MSETPFCCLVIFGRGWRLDSPRTIPLFYTLSGSKMKSGRGSQDAAWGLILARRAE